MISNTPSFNQSKHEGHIMLPFASEKRVYRKSPYRVCKQDQDQSTDVPS